MDAGGNDAVSSGTVGSPDAVPTALRPLASPDPAPPTGPVQPTSPVQPAASQPPPRPAATAAPARRRTTGLTVLLVALVIGATAGIGIAVWEAQRDDGSGEADGSGASPLLPGTDFAGTPTWIDDNTFVYGVGETGTAERFMTYTVGDDQPTALTFTDVPDAAVTHADWSDDQDRLLFLVHARRADGTFDPEYGDLWVADADLGNATRLGGPYGHPAWAPKGDQIVVKVKDADGAESLAVLSASDPADVTNLSDLADPPAGVVGVPAWGTR